MKNQTLTWPSAYPPLRGALAAVAWAALVAPCHAALPTVDPDKAEQPQMRATGTFAGAPATAARLASHRGGNVNTVVDQTGQVSDAVARNVTTGNNAIRDGSFSNTVGLNTVIQNSGANVLIQNSMTVNVQLK